uniref:Uncharacterized protein n=1 Tax=Clytia hemisphaerica TaxID=252671 RepID=A0A7M5UR41_9CNID
MLTFIKTTGTYLLLLFLIDLKGAFGLQCYHCSGGEEYCNSTNVIVKCRGPDSSCLLYYDTRRKRVSNTIVNVRVMRQGCAVERTNYCSKKMRNPGILSCKAYWCYKDSCNFRRSEISSNQKNADQSINNGPKGIVVKTEGYELYKFNAGLSIFKSNSHILIVFCNLLTLSATFTRHF